MQNDDDCKVLIEETQAQTPEPPAQTPCQLKYLILSPKNLERARITRAFAFCRHMWLPQDGLRKTKLAQLKRMTEHIKYSRKMTIFSRDLNYLDARNAFLRNNRTLSKLKVACEEVKYEFIYKGHGKSWFPKSQNLVTVSIDLWLAPFETIENLIYKLTCYNQSKIIRLNIPGVGGAPISCVGNIIQKIKFLSKLEFKMEISQMEDFERAFLMFQSKRGKLRAVKATLDLNDDAPNILFSHCLSKIISRLKNEGFGAAAGRDEQEYIVTIAKNDSCRLQMNFFVNRIPVKLMGSFKSLILIPLFIFCVVVCFLIMFIDLFS